MKNHQDGSFDNEVCHPTRATTILVRMLNEVNFPSHSTLLWDCSSLSTSAARAPVWKPLILITYHPLPQNNMMFVHFSV